MIVKAKEFIPPILLGPARAIRFLFLSEARRRRDTTVPPSDDIKQKYVIEYGKKYGISTFVETGTYLGDMINAVRKDFSLIYSIELSEYLYKRACKWFGDYDHIHLIHGNSGEKIKELVDSINDPCLFWLDAHYSGGITAKADIDTPIVDEIRHILSRKLKDVILIDDAQYFIGQDHYPTTQCLKSYVLSIRPEYKFYVKDEIIFIHAS